MHSCIWHTNLHGDTLMRVKEERFDYGYAQYFEHKGVTTRILTRCKWDELDVRMRDYYVERAEEYFRVRHHTDLGRVTE